MKKLFAAMLVVLTGCVSAPTFDAVEYNRIVILSHNMKQSSQYCSSDPAGVLFTATYIDFLQDQTDSLDIYVSHRPNHDQMKELVTIISKQLHEMHDVYKKEPTPSVAYCKGKFQILDKSLTKILNTIGGLPQQ